MEFKIPVEELQSVFSKLSNVVVVNGEQVTSMVLIEVGDTVKFKSVDGSVSLIIDTEQSEVIKKGKVLLRFSDVKSYIMKFVPLVDDYGTKEFHFIVEDDKGVIKTKTQYRASRPSYKKLQFQTFNNSLFPNIKPFGEASLIVNSHILKMGINKVLHCVNPKDVRQAVTGVNITIMEDKIVFTGTNGVKLVEFELGINADIDKKSYIFSYNFSSVLRNVLDEDAQVFMKFDGAQIYVKSNTVYLVGSLIVNESYPDYKPMFNLESTVTIPRLDFYDSVHTIMDVLNPEDNSRLSLVFEGSTLILKNDRLESVQEFDEPFGANLDIDVNGDFLESIIRGVVAENLSICFTTGNTYIVFKSDSDDKHTTLLTTVKRR